MAEAVWHEGAPSWPGFLILVCFQQQKPFFKERGAVLLAKQWQTPNVLPLDVGWGTPGRRGCRAFARPCRPCPTCCSPARGSCCIFRAAAPSPSWTSCQETPPTPSCAAGVHGATLRAHVCVCGMRVHSRVHVCVSRVMSRECVGETHIGPPLPALHVTDRSGASALGDW